MGAVALPLAQTRAEILDAPASQYRSQEDLGAPMSSLSGRWCPADGLQPSHPAGLPAALRAQATPAEAHGNLTMAVRLAMQPPHLHMPVPPALSDGFIHLRDRRHTQYVQPTSAAWAVCISDTRVVRCLPDARRAKAATEEPVFRPKRQHALGRPAPPPAHKH